MNLTVRDEAGDALELIERVHAGGASLAGELPLLFAEPRAARLVCAEIDGAITSVCSILERELVFPTRDRSDERLRVGLIGSVTTAAAFRGRGLASAVLARAEDELRARGCDVALLWAESEELYARLGYAAVGSERDLVLSPELLDRLPLAGEVDDAREADHVAMHTLYRAHARRVERSEAESLALYAAPEMTTLVARGAAGAPVAYVCCGRGRDLRGVVHEWAGDPTSVLACLRELLAHRATDAAALVLMAPSGGGEVVERLEDLGAAGSNGVLAMGKLLALEPLARRLPAECSRPLEVAPDGDGRVRLATPTGAVSLDATELLQLLLPAATDTRALDAVEAVLGASFAGLPWTPFLWGLDSI